MLFILILCIINEVTLHPEYAIKAFINIIPPICHRQTQHAPVVTANCQNDLTVLKLKTVVPDSMAYTPRIRKVALPYQGDNSFPKAGQTCTSYMKVWGCDKKGKNGVVDFRFGVV